MKILIFTQYYTPELPLRPCDMAPDLVRRGHEVTVVTAFPSYPKGKVFEGYKNGLWKRERLEGVTVWRGPVFPDQTLVPFRRFLYWTSVAAQAAVIGPLLRTKFDVAFAYGPTSIAFPAILTKWIRGVPFVYEVQDLFPESFTATGLIQNKIILNTVQRTEKFNCRQAAAVSVISKGFQRNLEAKGVPSQKIHLIPNWADESVYKIVPRDQELAESLGCQGRFNVVYGGNMGPAQALDTILDCAARLQRKTNVQFLLVGDGIEKDALKLRAKKEGLQNVRFAGPFPPRDMPKIYALADVLLLHLKKTPLFEITIPSKTVAYLASGRPIIGAIEGDTAEMIDDAHAGITCEPQNVDVLCSAIEKLRAMPTDQREQLGTNARNAFMKEYRKEVLITRMEHLFRQISRSQGDKRGKDEETVVQD